MQNFGATIKKHYGMLWYFLEWPIKPAYCIQQCMAKQFALSTRSFDKFQEKEAFYGKLPEGISQNIILRLFVKHQETFFFRFFFKFVVNADSFSQNTRLNSFHG